MHYQDILYESHHHQNAAMGQGIDLNANAIRQNTAAIQTINGSLANIKSSVTSIIK